MMIIIDPVHRNQSSYTAQMSFMFTALMEPRALFDPLSRLIEMKLSLDRLTVNKQSGVACFA